MTGHTKEDESEPAAPFLERMNNDEFREFLPHMELAEALCTEIYYNNKWIHLINVLKTKNKVATCYCCEEKFAYDHVKKHLRSDTHLEGLKKITQFYHPAYTYFRGARDLMNGKKVSRKELHEAIELANGGLSKLSNDVVALKHVKHVLKCDLEEAMQNPDFEKTLKSVVLNTEPKNPRNIYAVVHLPLLELLSIEFSVEKNIWKPMLTGTRPSVKASFQCNICNVSCRTIKYVNDHYSGIKHITNQLNALGVRCSKYDFLTKNCIYRYNASFTFYIKEVGRIHFRKAVEEMLIKSGAIKKEIKDEDKELALPELTASVKTKGELLKQQIEEFKENKHETNKVEKPDAINKEIFDNNGLMGVEYVVRIIQSFDNTKNEYECVLCEHVAKEDRMAQHLATHNHRLRYMELHYPDAIAQYKDNMGHMKYPSFVRVLSIVLAKVAIALEKYHGYGAVRDVLMSQYKKKRSQIVAEISSQPHASHEHGPSFSNIVSVEEVRSYIKQTELSVMNTVDHTTPERFTKPSHKNYKECGGPQWEHKARSERVRVRSRSPRGRIARRDKSSRKRSRTRSANRSRHHDNTHDVNSKADIWELYRKEVSKAAFEIENKYIDYRKHPDRHPMYKQEWNIFWKNRKESLRSKGLDHRGYNFQTEWGSFFKKRIEIFFGEDLQKSQREVRRRLNIPLDAEEDTQTSSELRHKRRRMDMNVAVPQWNDRAETLDYPSTRNQPPIISAPSIVDNKPNVIHVLRLMSALEEYLGSLGPKIMELLTKALSLKKYFGDNIIALEAKILTADNCSLIETAVEKLKGVLFAGLLDSSKEQSFNRVLQSTANLLRHAATMGYLKAQTFQPVADGSNGLANLLNALENANNNINPSVQKSLSDTLMNLLGGNKATSLSNGIVMPKQYGTYNDNVRNNQQRNQRVVGGGVTNNQQPFIPNTNEHYQQKDRQQSGMLYHNKTNIINKQMGSNGDVLKSLLSLDTNLNRSRNTVANTGNMAINGRNLMTTARSNYSSNFGNFKPRGVNGVGNRNMTQQ